VMAAITNPGTPPSELELLATAYRVVGIPEAVKLYAKAFYDRFNTELKNGLVKTFILEYFVGHLRAVGFNFRSPMAVDLRNMIISELYWCESRGNVSQS
jgi:hypothetical protein